VNFESSYLVRGADESREQYYGRIENILPFISGYAYFDIRNFYDAIGEFNLYIEWDEKLNRELAYPLPSGGYFIKCTLPQALFFHELGQGVPVYMKLTVHDDKLYAYRTYMIVGGRPYSVEFSGGQLIEFPERHDELGCNFVRENGKLVRRKSDAGSQRRYLTGSQMNYPNSSQSRYLSGSQQGHLTGSQRSYLTGSQRWYLGGSQRGYLTGSQRYMLSMLTSYLSGSQRSYLTGSQRWYLGGSQRGYLTGSQRYMWSMLTSYLSGSQRSYLTGSQRWYLGGSQRGYLTGSQR
jgi:hypothetical protein